MKKRSAYVVCCLLASACVPAGGSGGGARDGGGVVVPDPDQGRTLLLDAAPDDGVDEDGGIAADGAATDGGAADTGGADVGPAPDAAPPDARPIPPGPACDDGVDNDDDGLFDLADPDCSSPADPTERGENPITQCSNGEDDDGDGIVDFPDEPGCVSAGDDNEEDPFTVAACANGEDDDEDGLVDFPRDPGCQGRGDTLEDDPDPLPDCGNGLDDDGDGEVDYPQDLGCDSAADHREGNPCGEGVEIVDLNVHLARAAAYDGDLTGAPGDSVASCGGAAGGEQIFIWRVERTLDRLVFDTRHAETEAPVVMYLRRRCLGPDVACDRGAGEENGTVLVVERPAPGVYYLAVDTGSRNRVGRFRLTVDEVDPPQCRNLIDDDDDGLLDLADPGCVETEDDDELDPPEPPVCANGLDDDEDGATDYPDDEDCEAAGGDREAPLCGLEVPAIEVGQAGGEFELDILPAGSPSRAQGTCEPGPSPELLVVVTLDEPSDITVAVLEANQQPARVGLHARSDCLLIQSELACTRVADGGTISLPGLDRGVHYIFIEQGVVPPAAGRLAQVRVSSNLRECNDELDNDVDGLIDLADLGCVRGTDDDESDDPLEPPACANGIDDNGDGDIDWPDDAGCEAAGDPDEQPPCAGQIFGGVCVNHVSGACQNGSAIQYCAAENRGRVMSRAEFTAIVAGGWVRPNASYHTVTVQGYDQCAADNPQAIGNVGIPGWGERHWNCGDVHNYCNRAIICVR